VTDELAVEQAVVDRAYDALAAMRARTQFLFDKIMSTGGFGDLDHEVVMRRRIAVLADSPRPLVFGRLDEARGDRWYIGRRHVEDEHSEPVVIEWRAPVAEPFYQARPGEPRGLVRRRHLMVEAGRLLSIADDVFSDEAGESGEVRLRGGDALLAELERGRTGVMLDIVATIQAEQDDVIRAPLAGVLAVQGGPGTGKTAIGLHRAAFLLYNHPELARSEVMVVGPSRAFLGYIAQVLPSLGEEAVLQVTLADLVPDVRARAVDTDAAQMVKGDARMAAVIARAVADRRGELDGALVVRVGLRRASVEPDELAALVAEQVARGVPYAAGRAALRTRLVNLVSRRLSALDADPQDLTNAARTDPRVRAALDTVWPAVSPRTLVRELFSSDGLLARVADGILDADEQRALRRPRRAPWTIADLPLVDEAHAALVGHTATYGHVVVDEAQDLSPMQLRMIARRAPRGSVTVLGDLAQATAAWTHESWEEVVAHLPTPNGWRATTLTLGYRVPGQVLDFAARLLPEAAPGVPRTESVRRGLHGPRVVGVDAGSLHAVAASEAAALAADGHLVGVIVADGLERDTVRGFASHHVEVGVPERDGILRPVTVLPATAAKGLEFDAVVVVEPHAIVAGSTRGLRLLYVALTRPIQHLVVIHAEPLPRALDLPALRR
jgi:DNA helicase IV